MSRDALGDSAWEHEEGIELRFMREYAFGVIFEVAMTWVIAICYLRTSDNDVGRRSMLFEYKYRQSFSSGN